MNFFRDTFCRYTWLIIAVISATLLMLAPSNRSLWIDEGWSARIIMAPGNLAQLWQMILHDSAGMPAQLGHSFMGFLLGGILGYSEHSLRVANLVWAFAGVAAFTFAGKKLGISWLPLAFAANPFVWFYVDEIRPYAMQLAAGSWMMVSFLYFISVNISASSRTLWTNVFWFSSFVAYAASALGGFSIAAACCAALAALFFAKQFPLRGVWLSSVIWVILLSTLTAFYSYFIFMKGAGASKQWSPSLMNVAFAFYEISGIMGLGPSRDAIRAAAKAGGLESLTQLFIPYIGGLAAYTAVLGIAAYGIMKKSACASSTSKCALWLSIVVVLGLMLMLIGASLANWPFWGRHVAPLFPFASVAFALGFSALGTVGRIGAGIWITLMLLGSLHGRFIQTGQSDDYRSASQIAAEHVSAGQVVWWSADTLTPNYYKLFPASIFDQQKMKLSLPDGPSTWPRMKTNTIPLCYSVLGLSQEKLAQLPTPHLVITSKPDIWDPSGEIRMWLINANFVVTDNYPSFQVWRKTIEIPMEQ